MILITGAGGMLGSYLTEEFRDDNVLSLGVKESNDLVCDLRKEKPDFGSKRFSTVIHTAGTEDDKDAYALNYEGTGHLLESLEKCPPEEFVYISSYRVYSPEGENVDEEANTWAVDETGRSKALAEKMVREWAEKHNVTLTIIRPARMFGNGVHGETLMLFNDALNGKYIHVRGNDARVSLVCAYDVARAVKAVHAKGGLYNAADGRNPRFIEMVEAMTANAGAKKRMTHLPPAWAEWLWRLGRWIPAVDRNLSPEVMQQRLKTLTLSGERLAKAASITYHDTISVMELTDDSYPYTHKDNKKKGAVHEA